MDKKDLKIGNFVNWNGPMLTEFAIISSISTEEVSFRCGDYGLMEEIQPIPLTEQWLKDFGFEKELDNSMVKGDIAIFLDRRFKTNLFLRDNQENKWFSFNSKVEYVHQIQNLYFSLTGSELTLNR